MEENNVFEELEAAVANGESIHATPDDRVISGDLNFDELGKYDEGLMRGGNQSNLREGNQSTLKAFGNAAVQSLAEIGLGTLEGAGYLFDWEALGKSFTGSEREFGNWFSDIMKAGKEEVREFAPVHGGEGFQPGNPKYWAKNLPNIASSLSLLIPAAGVVRGVGMGAKMVGVGNNLSKGSKLAVKGFTGAVTSRMMENTMEASEKATSEYKKLIEKGMSEEKAKEEAGRQAANVWQANLINIIPDMFQYALLFGATDDILKGVAKTAKAKLGNVAKTMASEAAEEGLQYGISKEAKEDSIGGMFGKIMENVGDYFEDDDFKSGLLLGAVGGGVFSTIGASADSKILSKTSERLRKYHDAVASGNEYEANKQQEEQILTNSPEKNAEMKTFADETQVAKIEDIEAKREQAEHRVEQTAKEQGIFSKLAAETFNTAVETETKIVLNAEAQETISQEVDIAAAKVENDISSDLALLMADLKETADKPTFLLKDKVIAQQVKKAAKAAKVEIPKKYENVPLPSKAEKENAHFPELEHKVKTELAPAIIEGEQLKETKKKLKDPEAFEAEEKAKEVAFKQSKLDATDDLGELQRMSQDEDISDNATRKLDGRIAEVIDEIDKDYSSLKELYNEFPNLQEVRAVRIEPTGQYLEDVLKERFVEEVKEPSGAFNKLATETFGTQPDTPTISITNPFTQPIVEDNTPQQPIVTNEETVVHDKPVNKDELLTGKNPMRAKEQDVWLDSKTMSKITGNKELQAEWAKLFNTDEATIRNAIRHFDEYTDGKPYDSPVYIIGHGQSSWGVNAKEGNFHMIYAIKKDGKYIPLAIAPDFNKLSQDLTVNGKVVNPNFRLGYEFQRDARKELFSRMKANPNETVSLPYTIKLDDYQKGQYNNGTKVRSLKELAGDTPILLGGFKSDGILMEEIELSLGRNYNSDNARNLSDKKAGAIYLLTKDTVGNHRWNRVFTKSLHESPQTVQKINDILTKATDASMFLKLNGINPKTLWVKTGGKLDLKPIYKLRDQVAADKKNDFHKYKEHDLLLDWLENYEDYKKEIHELVRFKDSKGQIQPNFGINLFLTNRDSDGLFSVKKYTESIDLIDRTNPDKTVSRPIQIDFKKLNKGDYNESIKDILTTNLNNINDQFVAPTFYFGTDKTPIQTETPVVETKPVNIVSLESERVFSIENNDRLLPNVGETQKALTVYDIDGNTHKYRRRELHGLHGLEFEHYFNGKLTERTNIPELYFIHPSSKTASKTVVPKKRKRLGGNKKNISFKQTNINEDIVDVFISNKRLSNIGSLSQYNDYLKSIFPNSLVRDILNHRSNTKIEIFNKQKIGSTFGEDGRYKGFFFSDEDLKTHLPNSSAAQKLGDNLIKVKLNIKSIANDSIWEAPTKITNQDGVTIQNDDFIEYVVFRPEQIHILGSNKDIDEFSKFIRNNSNKFRSNSKENIAKFRKFAESKLGLSPKIVDGLIEIGGIKAFGVTYDATIELSKAAELGTGYHESFHLVFNNVFSAAERAKILRRSKINPTDAEIQAAQNTIDTLKANYENITVTARELAIEEKIADMFKDYQLGLDSMSSLRRFFKRLQEWIDGILGKRSQIDKLFRDISKGKFKHSIVPKVTSPRFQEVTGFNDRQEADLINIFLQMLDLTVTVDENNNKRSESEIEKGYKNVFNPDLEKNTLFSLEEDSAINQFIADLEERGIDYEDNQTVLDIIEGLRPDYIQGGEPRIGALGKKIQESMNKRGIQITTSLDPDKSFSQQISNKSVSMKSNLTARIKRLLSNQYTDKMDSLNLGFPIALDPDEAYSILQTEIGNSVTIHDMYDKIAASKFNWVNQLGEIISNKSTDIASQLFGQVGQKVHPKFKTIIEKDGKVRIIDSNQSQRSHLIINELYDKLADLDFAKYGSSLAAMKKEPQRYKERMLKFLKDTLPSTVVDAIIKDKAVVKTIESFVTGFKSETDGFKGKFRNTAKFLENYYPSTYQTAHLNVAGERVYEWMNSNFIGRLFNNISLNAKAATEMYMSDPMYMNLSLIKDIRNGSMKPSVVYTDGNKYNGKHKGVAPSAYSNTDSLFTMLSYFYNNGNKGMITQMPVMGDSPVNIGVELLKKTNKEAINGIVTSIKSEYDRIHSQDLDTKFKTYEKNKNSFVLFAPIMKNYPTNKGWDAELVKSLVNEYVNTVADNLNTASSKFKIDMDMFTKNGDTQGFLRQFAANHINYHSQLMLLTTGDSAFYKSTEDYYKRAKEIHSPGIFLNMEATWRGKAIPTTIKTKVATDIEIRSPQADEIETISGKGTYDRSSLTDAQTYIDIRSFMYRQAGLGRITPEMEKAFDILDSGKLPKSGAVWQTLKPFFYNLEKSGNNVVPVQKKDSEFVVVPFYGLETINGKENPTYNPEYKKILEEMGYVFEGDTVKFDKSKRQYDIFTFDTTMKVGRQQDGIQTLSMDSWRLQMETPEHHIDTDGLFGTQIMKLITANVKDTALIEEYNQLLNADIKRSYDEVAAKFESEDALRDMLKDEVINRGLGDEYLRAIEDKEFPLWHPSHYYRVSSVLNSLFKKKVTKRKFASGVSYINTSAYGFKNPPKIVWNEDGNPASGIKHFEAYAPIHNTALNKYKNADGFIDADAMKRIAGEDAKLLEGIVYRIPTEDKYSMIPIKIVGFLPIDAGNIVLPHEITTIAGLDFDIDKMFGFFFSNNPYTELLSQWNDLIESSRDYVAFDGLFTGIFGEGMMMEEKEIIAKSLFDKGYASKSYPEIKKLEAEAAIQIASDNRKLEIMRTILQSPDTVSSILTPQGFDHIKGVNEKIIAAQGIESSVDLINPMTLVEVAGRMNNGKQILGIYANGNAIHSILQQGNISLQSPVVFDKPYSQFGAAINGNGESITNNLGMRIGMAADNGKDPQASYYNANRYTADVEVMLLQLGVPTDTVQYFLAQPATKWFVEQYFLRGGNFQAEQDLISELQLDVKEHVLTGVTEVELIKGLNSKDKTFNRRMLMDFLVYKQQAQGVMAFQRAIKSSDNGAGVTGSDNYIAKRAVNNAAKVKYSQVLDGVFEFFDSDHYMNTFMEKGIVQADAVITEKAGMIKLGNDVGTTNFDALITKIENDKGITLTADEVTNLVNAYIDYAMSEAYPVDIPSIKQTIVELRAFKKANPEHPLTSRLMIVDESYIEFAGATGTDKTEINRIKKSWKTLGTSLETKLINYSIWQSGMSQGFKGFSHLQPFDHHQAELSKVKPMLEKSFGDLVTGDTVEMSRFYDQYVRNNFAKLSFVKSVPGDSVIMNNMGAKYPIQGTQYVQYIKSKGMLFKHVKSGIYKRIEALGEHTGRIKRFNEYSKGKLELRSKFNASFNTQKVVDLVNNSNNDVMFQLSDKIERMIVEGTVTKKCK